MSTELAQRNNGTDLTIAPDQTAFTDVQKSALAQIGVDKATEGDLGVFFHQAKRTGLDPFARQIHMIGRNSKKWDPETRTESWETKYTIQTGIDGYRLIGRRAADQAGQTISMDAPEWLHQDGSWRPAWSKQAWGYPMAARVTVYRNGQPFPAVAIFEEYVQTKRDGEPTQMWAQRPAGQLAKCAEALAWRMAFPQDLSGIYTHEEMAQADNPDQGRPMVTPAPAAAAPAARPAPAPSAATPAETSGPMISGEKWTEVNAALDAVGIPGKDKLTNLSALVGRTLSRGSELTAAEAERILADLAPADAGTHGDDVDDAEVVDEPAAA